MIFPFYCQRCSKDKWLIRFDSENKLHRITCAQCGNVELLEEVFGSRRKANDIRKAKAKGKLVVPEREAIGASATELV
jgi:DNA-directed RNA polymerase subunit RPC12/RpoP